MIRWVYLWVYGGLYADMDYLPLKSHEYFLKFMDEQNADILMSHEKKYGTGALFLKLLRDTFWYCVFSKPWNGPWLRKSSIHSGNIVWT